MREQILTIDLGGGYCASPLNQIREFVKSYDVLKYSGACEKCGKNENVPRICNISLEEDIAPESLSQIVRKEGDFLVVNLSAIMDKKL